MFFGYKTLIKRKLRWLLKAVLNDSESMSWKDELRAAKTIKIYTDLLEGDVTDDE